MGRKKEADKRTEAEKRSYTMSRIRSTDTSIEIALRKALYHAGVRYRVNYKALPGKPDIAITKAKLAVFCDGEFWHGKDWETKKEKIHSSREYWIPKIERTMARDKRNEEALAEMGWKVLRFWGGDIASDPEACLNKILEAIGWQPRISTEPSEGGSPVDEGDREGEKAGGEAEAEASAEEVEAAQSDAQAPCENGQVYADAKERRKQEG